MDSLHTERSLYPRVSEIIYKQNEAELRNIPIDTLANACTRGTKVHTYCTAWVNNLWVSDVEAEYEPYLNAFVDWANENIEECCHSSVRLFDDINKFTGEFDMIVKMKQSNTRVLLDIKTSASRSKSWPIQLSAYAHLCRINGYEFDTVMNLHLKKKYVKKEEEKGQAPLPTVNAYSIEYPNFNAYWEIFSSALKCYDYFTRKEVAQ